MSTKAKPLVEKWDIPPELMAKIRELDPTREWLRNPGNALEPYLDMYIAAQDCSVIAASKSYGGLKEQLEGEDCETYIILCLKPRIRIVPVANGK